MGRDDQANLAVAEELIKVRNSLGWAYITEQLRQEAEQTKDVLVFDVDANDPNAVRTAQDNVRIYYLLIETVEAIIAAGIGPEIVDELDREAEEEAYPDG